MIYNISKPWQNNSESKEQAQITNSRNEKQNVTIQYNRYCETLKWVVWTIILPKFENVGKNGQIH